MNHLHLAALDQLRQTAGQRGNDFFFAGAEGVDFDFRLGKLDTPIGQFLRFANHFGYVQQGLRRNAATQ